MSSALLSFSLFDAILNFPLFPTNEVERKKLLAIATKVNVEKIHQMKVKIRVIHSL